MNFKGLNFPDLQVMLNPNMTKSEEFEVAQELVAALDNFKKLKGFEELDALDLFAVAKHFTNVGKMLTETLSQAALQKVTQLIDNRAMCEKTGAPIVANKQFEHHGNLWTYVVKEQYDKLGDQFLPDGTRDPNSVSYHSCEMAQEKLKSDSKSLTAQMTVLRDRILLDHPKMVPSEVSVSLALKEATNG